MNVATGEVSTKLSADSNDWLDLYDKLLPQIFAQLGIVPAAEEKARMARRWIGSSEALDWYYKACLYQEQDRPLAEQEACLGKALAADPNCVGILVNLATMLTNQGKDEEAEDLVRKALRLEPDHAEAHSVLAIIYLHQEPDTQKAEDEIREACRLDPNEATHMADLAHPDSRRRIDG